MGTYTTIGLACKEKASKKVMEIINETKMELPVIHHVGDATYFIWESVWNWDQRRGFEPLNKKLLEFDDEEDNGYDYKRIILHEDSTFDVWFNDGGFESFADFQPETRLYIPEIISEKGSSIKDPYKVHIIREILKNMKDDEFYLAQLRSSKTKNINLDEGALKLLLKYYEGKVPADMYADEKVNKNYR